MLCAEGKKRTKILHWHDWVKFSQQISNRGHCDEFPKRSPRYQNQIKNTRKNVPKVAPPKTYLTSDDQAMVKVIVPGDNHPEKSLCDQGTSSSSKSEMAANAIGVSLDFGRYTDLQLTDLLSATFTCK